MSRKAASFSSLPIAPARRSSHDFPDRFFRALAAVCDPDGGLGRDRLGRHLLPQAAHRCVSRSLSSARGDHHAMAGPRGRGNRAPHFHPSRSGDERHPENRSAAFHFAVRALGARDEFRIRHRSVFCQRTSLRTAGERDFAEWSHRRRLSSLQPQRIGLPLCAGEPGPHSARAEDYRGLGPGTPLSCGLRGRRRFEPGRHHHAVSGIARSEPAVCPWDHGSSSGPAIEHQ